MKVAIVGSRSFDNYELLKHTIEKLHFSITQIISGGAKGADSLAEQCAEEFNIPIIIHKPDWAIYGKAAGIVRNKKIIDDCEYCLVFWDQKSYGTKSSIDYCVKAGKPLHVVDIS